jgi:hypothetical protein
MSSPGAGRMNTFLVQPQPASPDGEITGKPTFVDGLEQ